MINALFFLIFILWLIYLKDPQQRPTADELLKHKFISGDLDSKPLRDLLLEYKAEVVEEELLDDDAEVRCVIILNQFVY